MARTSISKSTRFEVFKRDAFTCQYCGSKAPDVVLEVDHIDPVANGGTNDILNLVTACRPCNAGKADKSLSVSAAVSKAMTQASELNDRRVQIEMIAEWHRGLLRESEHATELLCELWLSSFDETDGHAMTPQAREELRALQLRFGFDVVCQAISQAVNRFRRKPQEEQFAEDRTSAFWSLGKICSVIRADRANPGLARLLYIRGILRNRCGHLNAVACIALLKEAMAVGVSIDEMERAAKAATSWSWYRAWLNGAIESVMAGTNNEA